MIIEDLRESKRELPEVGDVIKITRDVLGQKEEIIGMVIMGYSSYHYILNLKTGLKIQVGKGVLIGYDMEQLIENLGSCGFKVEEIYPKDKVILQLIK